jgi:type II secretory pathway pseudopilin PulG
MNISFTSLNKRQKTGFTPPTFIKKVGGFTLIEMIIYIFFVGTFSVLALNGVFHATKVFADFRITRDLNSTAEVILDRVTREVRQAYDVDQVESSFGTHPGRLTLKTIDPFDVDTTIEFYIDSGNVKIKEGGVGQGLLGSSDVAVDIFVFNFITNTNTKAVKTRLQLTAQRGSSQKTKTFYATTILRGSYSN